MSDLSSRVIAEARAWIGTPYRHQASLRGIGCDCLGLVRGVWRAVHGAEPEAPPPYSRDWAEASGSETLRDAAARHMRAVPLADLAPGHLVLFAFAANLPAKHCAIVVTQAPLWTGSQQLRPMTMVHACDGHPVAEVAFVPWWRKRVRFVFSFERPCERPFDHP
jgi:NlpC/P60 family putative phage cell wall peptidase